MLVAQGATRDFNPALSQKVIDRAMERDAASASAEYLAQFRTDIEDFVSREAVEGCVINGRFELLPGPGLYVDFVDPSGGSSDSFTLAIAHRRADGVVVLDCVRERGRRSRPRPWLTSSRSSCGPMASRPCKVTVMLANGPSSSFGNMASGTSKRCAEVGHLPRLVADHEQREGGALDHRGSSRN